jgi:hypothetical protein
MTETEKTLVECVRRELDVHGEEANYRLAGAQKYLRQVQPIKFEEKYERSYLLYFEVDLVSEERTKYSLVLRNGALPATLVVSPAVEKLDRSC